MRFGLLSYLLKNRLSLLCDDVFCLQVVDLVEHRTLHYCTTLIILDIPRPYRTIEGDFLRETLLPEITNSIVIRVCEEVHHCRVGGFDVGFKVIHEHTTISLEVDEWKREFKPTRSSAYLHLVNRGGGKKYNLGETSMRKRSKTNPANDLVTSLDNGKAS